MLILTFIIVFTNLSIVYFNQIASVIIIVLTIFARYSHKNYTNYLMNQDNLTYLDFKSKKEAVKPQKKKNSHRKYTSHSEAYGKSHPLRYVNTVRCGLCACFGLLVYFHNSLSNNLVDTNNNIINTCNNLKDVNMHIHTNGHLTKISQQLDSNDLHYSQMYSNINQKVTNLKNTVQEVFTNLVNVGK